MGDLAAVVQSSSSIGGTLLAGWAQEAREGARFAAYVHEDGVVCVDGGGVGAWGYGCGQARHRVLWSQVHFWDVRGQGEGPDYVADLGREEGEEVELRRFRGGDGC